MKFIHIGDVHLGATPDAKFNNNRKEQGKSRGEDIFTSFDRVLDICNKEQIDLLLIAGDLYHRQPLLKELKELNYKFSRLQHTKVVMIAGNHDYISSRSFYPKMAWNENVTMLLDEDMQNIYIEEIDTTVYGFSYHTREVREAKVDEVPIKNKDSINLLLAHGGTQNDVPMNVSSVLSNGFDYVALGHIHIPRIIEGRLGYCGSLEPLDRTEVGPRGYIKGEVQRKNGKKEIALNFQPISICEYVNLSIPIDTITTNGQLQDYIIDYVGSHGMKYLYNIILSGYRDSEFEIGLVQLEGIQQVVSVIDNSMPNYDFDELKLWNQDNMIGQFITNIMEKDKDEELKKKALYYGISALLQAKKE